MVHRSAPGSLARLEPGVVARVVETDRATAAWIEDTGIVAGARLTVERRIPLGGPLVVRIGTARVAIARRLAEAILVTAAGETAAGETAGETVR